MKQAKESRAFEIDIEKLVYGGMGLGHCQGKVVFTPFSVPGDRLLVRPIEEKRTFIRAETVRIIQQGKGRVEPTCPHFAACGGCHWQQLEYVKQVEAKQQILEEILNHRFPETRGLPIVMRACPQPLAYRSRARIQTRGSGPTASVGFFRGGSHVVEDVASCPLFRRTLNEGLCALRKYKFQAVQDARAQEWDLACSEEENAWAAALVGPAGPNDGTSVLTGSGRSDTAVLEREVGEFRYSVEASAFFQANDFMAPELVRLVQESAQHASGASVLDLFAGVGLFSLPLARHFQKVVAVENSNSSCRLCTVNASATAPGRIQVICADVSGWLGSETSSTPGPFSMILLDPPRTGAGIPVMERIREWAPEVILYVSCDPQTLARDLAIISPGDYQIDLVEGLDMFPQTYHFETVVRLVRRP